MKEISNLGDSDNRVVEIIELDTSLNLEPVEAQVLHSGMKVRK